MHWQTILELKRRATTQHDSYFESRGNVSLSELDHSKFASLIIDKCIEELALGLFEDTDDNLERWQEDRNDGINHCIRKLVELRDEQ